MAPEPSAPYAIRQFEIDRWIWIELFGVDMSFTNSSSAMVTTLVVVSLFMMLGMRGARMVPGRMQAAAEGVYQFIADTVTNHAGPNGARHIPFVFTLFVFILFGSLIGLTPIKFTFTSHLVVTVGLALIVFFYVTALGFRLHGLGFLRNFVPSGTPIYIAPLIALIEVISYLFRPITLGVRLFANVLAGHIMIKLFADFSTMMGEAMGPVGYLLGLIPMMVNVIFFSFEIVVFLIQSYIFVLLTCVYIRSSTEAH
jgi:F-type H+-transporting ATPase subunit a